jgi:hypothetical protein
MPESGLGCGIVYEDGGKLQVQTFLAFTSSVTSKQYDVY